MGSTFDKPQNVSHHDTGVVYRVQWRELPESVGLTDGIHILWKHFQEDDRRSENVAWMLSVRVTAATIWNGVLEPYFTHAFIVTTCIQETRNVLGTLLE